MHEMSEFIDSSGIDGVKVQWNTGGAKTLLYATLDFYDQNESRFVKTRKNSPVFAERLAKARKIIHGTKFVSIGSVLE
jgi:hypothetical protein